MFGRLTPMVKNLLILNVGIHIMSGILRIDFSEYFAFYGFQSTHFMAYQLFTYMFLHADGLWHIFFNMLILLIIGPLLESFWGPGRFLKFYLITGIGAALIFGVAQLVEFSQVRNDADKFNSRPTPEGYYSFMRDHVPEFKRSEGLNNLGEEFYDNPDSRELQKAASEYINLFVAREKNSPMLGASGAIYGLLIAAGLLFPNTQLMLIIPPMPVKLKYIAFVLGALAIFNAWNNAEGDTTAHFAHLGGMIIGIIVVKIWNKDRSKFF